MIAESFVAHLVGDYIFQTDAMANRKTKSSLWCGIHVATYMLPFLLLPEVKKDVKRALPALAVMAGTHFLIDRFRLARYVVAAKNSATDPKRTKEFFSTPTGFGEKTPDWLAGWLFIISDNTMHLAINTFALNTLVDDAKDK